MQIQSEIEMILGEVVSTPVPLNWPNINRREDTKENESQEVEEENGNPNDVTVKKVAHVKESLKQLHCNVTDSNEPVKCNLRSLQQTF